MDTVTLSHVEPAPPGPDLPGQLAALQRKAERHKAALAQLEKRVSQTKRQLRQKTVDVGVAQYGIEQALELLRHEAPTEARDLLDRVLLVLRFGDDEARARALATARRRDHALVTLRGRVSQLHLALDRAKAVIRQWHGMRPQNKDLSISREQEVWGSYQSSPEMQEINKELGH